MGERAREIARLEADCGICAERNAEAKHGAEHVENANPQLRAEESGQKEATVSSPAQIAVPAGGHDTPQGRMGLEVS